MTQVKVFPAGIEIFRAGCHIDKDGASRTFSPDDVAAIAAGYRPGTREAPIVVGHPNDNAPAYGWVDKLRATDDGVLVADLRDVEPQFAEMVRTRRFPKRSASFYSPDHPSNPTPGQWYLRHIGFLGAQPPAIAGLKDSQFSDDATGIVSFEEIPAMSGSMQTPAFASSTAIEDTIVTEEEKTALEARLAKAEAETVATLAKLAEVAECRRLERHSANIAFCEAALKDGRLQPKHKSTAIAVLDMLSDAAPVEFSEGNATRKVSPHEFVQELIGTTPKAISFGEHAPGSASESPINVDDDDAVTRAAKTIAATQNVSFSEAVRKVYETHGGQ